ncbi:MAG: CoA-binding protein [Myxococcales bacterium]|nr:CoA-binding protein [Myxococcales bacterium]
MLISDADLIEQRLRDARRIVVLGIKPESRRSLDAYGIPLYLSQVGYEVVPVVTRYPEVDTILGRPVLRSLAAVEGPVDVLNVWVRADALAAYVDAIVALRPKVVWVQSGLLDEGVERALLDAGLDVIEDCIGCRRASMPPAWKPLWSLG